MSPQPSPPTTTFLIIFAALPLLAFVDSSQAQSADARCFPARMLEQMVEDIGQPPVVCLDFAYQALFEDAIHKPTQRLTGDMLDLPDTNTWKQIGTNNYDTDYYATARTAAWATVAFMVQPDGFDPDAVLLDSSRDRFNLSAISSAEGNQYKPATLDDIPVPGLFITTYYFNGWGLILGGGVHEKVIKQYDKFNKALEADDERRATRELNKVLRMKSTIIQGSLATVVGINYLFRFRHAQKWAREKEQFAMLRKAVGFATQSMYPPQNSTVRRC